MAKKILLILLIITFNKTTAQNFKWAQKIGSTQSDFTRAIDTDNSGNTFLMGGFNGTIVFPGTGSLASRSINSMGGIDIYLTKMGCNKNLIWKNFIGGTGNECGSFSFLKIKYDNKGSIYATGTFSGTATFSSTSGTSQTLSSNGGSDIFLAKYDTSGVLIWVVNSGGIGTDEGCSLNLDNDGNIICGGLFSNIATFGTKSGLTINKTSSGGHDIFISKYSPAGVLQWVNTAGGQGLELAIDITIDRQNNIYVVGNFGYSGYSTTFGTIIITNLSLWGGIYS